MKTSEKISKSLTIKDFCTVTKTYQLFQDFINPYPQEEKTLDWIRQLGDKVIKPIEKKFGASNFALTYGFCAKGLLTFLRTTNPKTGKPFGRIYEKVDQHMGEELNRNGKPYCKHPGIACDFYIKGVSSKDVLAWLLIDSNIPYDSIYYYGEDRPIHISYGVKQRKQAYRFTEKNTPVRIKAEEFEIKEVKKPVEIIPELELETELLEKVKEGF